MEKDGESNDDDMQEDYMDIMIDLEEVAGNLFGVNASTKENWGGGGNTDENDGGPLISLQEFCINVLSSPIFGDARSKGGGGYYHIISDCVKYVCSVGMAFM